MGRGVEPGEQTMTGMRDPLVLGVRLPGTVVAVAEAKPADDFVAATTPGPNGPRQVMTPFPLESLLRRTKRLERLQGIGGGDVRGRRGRVRPGCLLGDLRDAYDHGRYGE